MVLNQNADYSHIFTPDAVSDFAPNDLYNFGVSSAPPAQAETRPRFYKQAVAQLPDGIVWKWTLLIEDVRGGLNRTVGYYGGESQYRREGDWDRISQADADGRFYRTLILPQLTTVAATPDPGGTLKGLHSCNIFGTLVLGVGSTADKALFTETSSTDPTIISKTYTPASAITGLASIVAGGATNAARLAIMHSGSVAQLMASDYTTVTGMHADTNPCWGMIQTPLYYTSTAGNAVTNPILIYSKGAIRILDSVATVSDAPQVGLSNVPNGGFALGMAKLAGAPIRPYWVWPYANTTGSMLANGSETPGHVVSTNQEGTDYQEIPMGIKYIYSAVIVNNNAIVATDKERIMYYDGKSASRDLQWTTDRVANSDRVFECRGLMVNNNEVWARVGYKASPNGTGNTQTWWEVYNLESNAWYQTSATGTMTSTGTYGLLPSGTLPLSDTTGFAHVYEDGSWRRMFVPTYGKNPFTLYRNTSGSQATTGNEYEASATYTSPYWELPGLEGWPKIVSRITFLGDVDAGGQDTTDASVTVTAGNLTGLFKPGLPHRSQLMEDVANLDMFYQLQVSITLTRNSGSTRRTPNGIPIIVEGYCYQKNPQSFGWLDDAR